MKTKNIFCVEVAGECYVQDIAGCFLGKDGRWTTDLSEAWTTRDREHAQAVAKQQDEHATRAAHG